MKELPHGCLLPADYTKEAFPKKAVRFVLKNAIQLIPPSLLIFAGCSLGTGAENNPQELDRQPSGHTLPLRMEESSAAEKQAKTHEQQAKVLALDKFLSLLYSSQSIETNPEQTRVNNEQKTATLTSTIENRKLVNGHLAGFPYSEVLKGKQAADNDNLLFDWMYSKTDYQQPDGRVVGQGEIKNIRIYPTANFISVADKANGVEWQGKVSMAYVARLRFLVPFITSKHLREFSDGRTTVEEWATSGTDEQWAEVAKKPSGPFSEWSDKGMSFDMVLKNGQWEFVDNQFGSVGMSVPMNYPLDLYNIKRELDYLNYSQEGYPSCNKIPGCEEFHVTLK